MKILHVSTASLVVLMLLPCAAMAGTVSVNSGPNLTPPGSFSASTLAATAPESDQAALTGGATITPPSSNSVSINMSGTFAADVNDLTTVAFTFTVDANVTGNTTYEINGSASPSSATNAPGGGHFSQTGPIAPGSNVYSMALPAPGPVKVATSGMFNLTLTFHFNAPASSAPGVAVAAPAPSAAAPGTIDVSIAGVLFQVSPTAATPPSSGGTPTPTSTPTPTPTLTPTPTPSPTASASPTPTPSPTPSSALLLNLSTREDVQTGNGVLIGGFIITGANPKPVVIRGLGPSVILPGGGTVLADPVLELHEPDGTVVTNDNWTENNQTDQGVLTSNHLAPSSPLESALVANLDPGSYTAIVSGKNGSTGVGLVEVYDLGSGSDSQLANLSSRGLVQTGEDVMIGGFILGPTDATTSAIVVRAIGPSLTALNVPGALADPALELHDGNGTTIASNDNWIDGPDAQTIADDGLAPTSDLESALLLNSPPAAFTAVVSGVNGSTGVALVEVYDLR